MADGRGSRREPRGARPRRATPFLVLAGVLSLAALLAPLSFRARMAGEAHARRGAAPSEVSVEIPPGDTGVVLPGVLRVADVDATPAGWTVLDGPVGPAVAIGADGRVGPALGRPGDGPGEVSAARHAATWRDRVAILDIQGRRLDVLGEGAEPARVEVAAAGCGVSTAEDLAADAAGWLVLRRCLGAGGARAQVVRIAHDGAASVVAEEALTEAGIADPFLRPVLVVDGSVWLGTTRSGCLRRIAGTGDRQVCLAPVEPLPVPSDVRRRLEGSLAARARAAGVRLLVPDALPPFAGLRPTASGWAVQRWRPSGDAAWVLEHPSGGRLELVPPRGTTLEPGPAGVLLLRQEMVGLRAWVLPAPSHPAPGAGGPR